MDFLGSGIPIGRYFGINVRLHFTFLIFAFFRIQSYQNVFYGIAFIGGLYLCILLHEFGHALAARWADGDAEDILLWPLGGLAYCRPAWHPTAHLICTVAGPFVTFLLWIVFGIASLLLGPLAQGSMPLAYVWFFTREMALLNMWLLIFNLIPAFPMDGGRILRDTLWHWMNAEKATIVAVWVSRGIAILGGLWALSTGNWWIILIALFIFFQAANEQRIVAFEATGTYGFSLRERLKRGRRQRAFRGAVTARVDEDLKTGFHRCAVCGRTENDDAHLDFRVCTDCADGSEYCAEHLSNHRHR